MLALKEFSSSSHPYATSTEPHWQILIDQCVRVEVLHSKCVRALWLLEFLHETQIRSDYFADLCTNCTAPFHLGTAMRANGPGTVVILAVYSLRSIGWIKALFSIWEKFRFNRFLFTTQNASI